MKSLTEIWFFLLYLCQKKNREEETKKEKNTLEINDNLERFIGDLTSKIRRRFYQTVINNKNEKKDENGNWNRTKNKQKTKKMTMSLQLY